jgi:hypothetical protein
MKVYSEDLRIELIRIELGYYASLRNGTLALGLGTVSKLSSEPAVPLVLP